MEQSLVDEDAALHLPLKMNSVYNSAKSTRPHFAPQRASHTRPLTQKITLSSLLDNPATNLSARRILDKRWLMTSPSFSNLDRTAAQNAKKGMRARHAYQG